MTATPNHARTGPLADLLTMASASGDPDVRAAAKAWMRHMAVKLLAEPRHKVLELECGAGYLSSYLATVCSATVVGLGGSEKAANLASLNSKYSLSSVAFAEVEGHFDRLIWTDAFSRNRDFKGFFNTAVKVLRKESVLLLQGVAAHTPAKTGPPAISQIIPHLEQAFIVVKDLEIMQDDYVGLINKCQAEAGSAGRPISAALDGLADSLERGELFVYQLQLARHANVVPFTRAYIPRDNEKLKAREQTTGN